MAMLRLRTILGTLSRSNGMVMVNTMQALLHLKIKNPAHYLQGLAGVSRPVNINQYAAYKNYCKGGLRNFMCKIYNIEHRYGFITLFYFNHCHLVTASNSLLYSETLNVVSLCPSWQQFHGLTVQKAKLEYDVINVSSELGVKYTLVFNDQCYFFSEAMLWKHSHLLTTATPIKTATGSCCITHFISFWLDFSLKSAYLQ